MEGDTGVGTEAKTETTAPQPTRARRVWRALRWPLLVVFVLYVVLVVYRVPAAFDRQKTAAAVAFMQSQKLGWATAVGTNLPEAPDEALNNVTLVGTDANHNGIRDDVERAITKLHPDSTRVRAAELQYALELELELTSVFNTETWIAEAKYEAHGIGCLVQADYYPGAPKQAGGTRYWEKEVEGLVFNTTLRKLKVQSIQVFETAFADSGNENCDIDLHSFPN